MAHKIERNERKGGETEQQLFTALTYVVCHSRRESEEMKNEKENGIL